jgi:HAD superfamily hydrolase (TIGR01509 family)
MNPTKLIVKGILFDLDGTILDTRPAYLYAAKTALKLLGQPIPEEDRLLQIPKRLELKMPITDIVPAQTQQFLILFLRTFYETASQRTIPAPYVGQTLQVLSQRMKLAVITMRYMSNAKVAEELRRHGLDGYFAHIVTALDTPKPKPSPQALVKAVEAIDVEMCACVIVGDSVVDVEAGRAAGAKTVAVTSGLYTLEELEAAKPDFIIKAISDLPSLLA